MKGKYGWKKRLLAFALSAVIGVTAVPFAGVETVQAAELKGVGETHWARESMQKMYDQGILSGDAEGNMHPNRAVTRAEFISMLNRAFNYTQYTGGELPFTDMTGEEWYATHIRVAYSQGYFSGVAPDLAGATQPITREAAAAMLCRNLKVDTDTLQLTQFIDGTSISQWSRGAVGAAVDKGFLSGYEDKTFRPKNNISRAEAATMLSNALGTIISQGGTYSGLFDGNVTLASSNVILKDAVIAGDLYITEGVGTGYADLENVTVLGEVIVCGGGEGKWGGNSVEFKHCTIQKLTVDGSDERPVSLYATGDTTIAETNIKSTTYLQNHADTVPGFDNIRVFGPEDTTLYLSGNFRSADLVNRQNHIVVGKGEIEMLTVDEDAAESTVQLDRGVVVKTLNLDGQTEVTGRGDIESLVVTTDEVEVEQLPDKIEIRPGVTAEIAGKEMTSMDADESSSAPRILAGYPKADEITPFAANILFSANKPGTIRWALTYNDVEELTLDEILKPTTITRIQQHGTLTVGESGQELKLALAGLEANAKFTVSAVLVDDRNDVSRIKDAVFRTRDNTPPSFVEGYPITVPHSSHRFDIEAMPMKECTIYWAVFPQGAAAPTVYQLRSQDIDGAIIYGEREDCERNQVYILEAEHPELKEDVVYDVYVMASDGENVSEIIKLTGVTKDTTPPEFLNDTPKQDKNDVDYVDVRVRSNEEGLVHYVVCEWDETFPVPVVVDGKLMNPVPLDSEEARQQVLTGNNALIAGSANVLADEDVLVQIDGLEEETPYQVFMLLEDRSGNLSVAVKRVEIKTKDVTPPTAQVLIDNPIDGKAPIKEPIKIAFSEIVWNALDTSGGKEPSAGNLTGDVVKLFDVTMNNEEVPVDIDFSRVTNEMGDKGATILVFPPEAFPRSDGTFGLNSGSRYIFELNNIMDTSGNFMKKDTRLDFFETVPPLVVLTETGNRGGKLDYTFSMVPQSQQTADHIMFDMLLTSDHNIEIELYERTSSDGTFTKLVSRNGSTSFQLSANILTSLHLLLGNAGTAIENPYEPFNQLDAYREYGINIVAIDGDTNKLGWHTTVDIDVTCVAGQDAKLTGLFNGNNTVGDGEVSDVNFSTQNLNDSKEFIVEMPFIDNIVPSFIAPFPRLTNEGMSEENKMITDILIRPQLYTDRKATLYYFIAPKGNIHFNADEFVERQATYSDGTLMNDINGKPIMYRDINETGLNRIKQGVRSNAYAGAGTFWGTLEIPTGGTLQQPTLPLNGDLSPETDYELFIVLKGVPEELSDVYYRHFRTEQIAPPVLSANVISRGENSVDIEIISDKRALVDWIVLRVNDAEQYRNQDGTASDPARLAEMIRNRQELAGSTKPIDDGGGVTQQRNDGTYSMQVTIDNVERPMYYVLIAVAKMQLSDGKTVGGDSDILFSVPFTPADLTPPNLEFTTRIYWDSIDDDDEFRKNGYSGLLQIQTTDDALFYLLGEGSQPKPLDQDAIEDYLVPRLQGGNFKFTLTGGDGNSNLTLTEVFDEDGNSKGEAATFIRLEFSHVFDRTKASLADMRLCDVNGNIVEIKSFEFVDMEGMEYPDNPNTDKVDERADSYWEVVYN